MASDKFLENWSTDNGMEHALFQIMTAQRSCI
ncbi:hypothetical protein MPTK1_7g05360 [Marchantia polymorpha subsp. ruderalis]|uniref:Uncharacterized protein n=2 Tax=Marchantia polymorpha TaxID=3197 RepID=A0AAF6BWD5_MARPO|nr:hypothetical protein MARPO_0218s0004 [Marchantia polymorpha]BBN16319.1 hypothetical protein Mp_7g05360 [Marchantia polymorpha subsp. ruderalis]|eukprot:PTQ27124.1 hypothetical protein MARPO_0218s0004 [Marchantia polymorpha]